MMKDARVMTIDLPKGFLASSKALTFKGSSREEVYLSACGHAQAGAWIERTLRSYKYRSRPPSEGRMIKRCMRLVCYGSSLVEPQKPCLLELHLRICWTPLK